MTNKQYKIPDDFFDQLKNFFTVRGFSDEQFGGQMQKLGELIVMSAFIRLIKQKPPPANFNSGEEAADYIAHNFSKEEQETALKEEGHKLVTEYLKNLDVPGSAK